MLKILVESELEQDSFVSNSTHRLVSPTPTPTWKTYKDYFEVPFLQTTEEFYRHEAAGFLVRNSVCEYLKKVCIYS